MPDAETGCQDLEESLASTQKFPGKFDEHQSRRDGQGDPQGPLLFRQGVGRMVRAHLWNLVLMYSAALSGLSLTLPGPLLT